MTDAVVVLGLGRMGRAMAQRYGESGWAMHTWSRSGGGTATSARGALDAPSPVVLALFDDHACDDVLDLLGETVAGRLVINTSTVSVGAAGAAAARVTGAGGRYVHAPVLGSVPAVLTGTLRVLAGGSVRDVAEAATALAPVAGEVRHVGGPRDPAAAKLVANSSLAGTALALRDALDGAAALGMGSDDALDVLELGRLGDLARAVRTRLRDPGAAAYFTVGALAKDARLLAEAGGPPGPAARIHSLLADGAIGPDDDFTALGVPVAQRAEAR